MTALHERPVTAAAELTGVGDDAYMEPLNPVRLEQEILRTRQRIARGIRVVSAARREARDKRRAYKAAYARAWVAAVGAQYARRYIADADPAVVAAEEAMDVAEAAYEYALDTARSLRDDLSALQSIGRSVTAMYSSERGVGAA